MSVVNDTMITMETTLDNKIAILNDTWLELREVPEMADFFAYNDLGLPLAYLLFYKIVKNTPDADKVINETFASLLEHFDLADTGYTNLDQIVE